MSTTSEPFSKVETCTRYTQTQREVRNTDYNIWLHPLYVQWFLYFASCNIAITRCTCWNYIMWLSCDCYLGNALLGEVEFPEADVSLSTTHSQCSSRRRELQYCHTSFLCANNVLKRGGAASTRQYSLDWPRFWCSDILRDKSSILHQYWPPRQCTAGR